jgi:hypothetical protein
MTVLLEKAIERMRALPAEAQDDFARLLLRLAGDSDAVYDLAAEEEADLIEADAEIVRGELAAAAEVEAVFSKYRM